MTGPAGRYTKNVGAFGDTHGVPENVPATQRKNISVPPGRPADVWAALEAHCRYAGRSMSSVVIDAVEAHLATLTRSHPRRTQS